MPKLADSSRLTRKPQIAVFGALRLVAVYCTLTLLSTLALATETFSAEEKLEAIKQALVDLAMESEVTLGSAAYIDSQGVLHESALMSSNSQVRGVRVLSYLEEAGIPVARVEASMLSDRTCPGARPELRREALLRTGHRGVNKRLGDHYLSEVATLSKEVVMSALSGSTAWTARPEVRYSSNYDNLVSGGSSERIPYRFDVTISEHNPAAVDRHQVFDVIDYGASMGKAALDFAFGYSEWTGMAGAFWGVMPMLDEDAGSSSSSAFPLRKAVGYYSLSMLPAYARSVAPWPSANLDYELVIVDRKREMPLWRKTLTLSYPRLPKGFTKSDMPPEFRHQIMLATEQMMAEATASMTCTAQYYHLSNADGERGVATINAGSLAGVRLGDQFLLSSDPNILNAAVNAAALSSLALARVESVNRHTAVLKHIAGPKWSSAQANDNFVALYF
tara:strand:- start:437 stop:1780 length:1344 start_codon:yes stop_codon:yes gene_type:complete